MIAVLWTLPAHKPMARDQAVRNANELRSELQCVIT
jgi:hypothetical protein